MKHTAVSLGVLIVLTISACCGQGSTNEQNGARFAYEDQTKKTIFEKATHYKNKGDKFFQNGETEKAKAAYEKMFLEFDSMPFERDGVDVINIQKMFTLDSNTPSYHRLLVEGVFGWKSGDVPLALENITDAIEQNPIFPLGYLSRAALWSSISEYRKAFADLNTLEALYPTVSYSYGLKGEMFYEQRDFENALIAYGKFVELKPSDHEAYYYCGRAYAELGKNDLALRAYDKSIELYRDGRTYFFRGALKSLMGKTDDALSDYLEALKNESIDDSYLDHLYYRIAKIYIYKKEYQKAACFLDKLIKSKPDDSWAYEKKGLIYASQGRYNDARVLFNRAADLDPDSLAIREHLKHLNSGKGGKGEREGGEGVTLK